MAAQKLVYLPRLRLAIIEAPKLSPIGQGAIGRAFSRVNIATVETVCVFHLYD
jgi:hypothetical protein